MEQKKKMSTTQKLSTSSYKTVSHKKEHRSTEFLKKKKPQITCDKLKSHCFEYRKYIIITLIKYEIGLFLIIYLVSTY